MEFQPRATLDAVAGSRSDSWCPGAPSTCVHSTYRKCRAEVSEDLSSKNWSEKLPTPRSVATSQALHTHSLARDCSGLRVRRITLIAARGRGGSTRKKKTEASRAK